MFKAYHYTQQGETGDKMFLLMQWNRLQENFFLCRQVRHSSSDTVFFCNQRSGNIQLAVKTTFL